MASLDPEVVATVFGDSEGVQKVPQRYDERPPLAPVDVNRQGVVGKVAESNKKLTGEKWDAKTPTSAQIQSYISKSISPEPNVSSPGDDPASVRKLFGPHIDDREKTPDELNATLLHQCIHKLAKDKANALKRFETEMLTQMKAQNDHAKKEEDALKSKLLELEEQVRQPCPSLDVLILASLLTTRRYISSWLRPGRAVSRILER